MADLFELSDLRAAFLVGVGLGGLAGVMLGLVLAHLH